MVDSEPGGSVLVLAAFLVRSLGWPANPPLALIKLSQVSD